MSKIKNETNSLLAMIRQGKPMTGRQQLWLTVQLSVPAIVAQLSSILMQYIDASMVGSLGANASASIGLVSICESRNLYTTYIRQSLYFCSVKKRKTK